MFKKGWDRTAPPSRDIQKMYFGFVIRDQSYPLGWSFTQIEVESSNFSRKKYLKQKKNNFVYQFHPFKFLQQIKFKNLVTDFPSRLKSQTNPRWAPRATSTRTKVRAKRVGNLQNSSKVPQLAGKLANLGEFSPQPLCQQVTKDSLTKSQVEHRWTCPFAASSSDSFDGLFFFFHFNCHLPYCVRDFG